jgi:hypothetical protein
MQPTIRRRASLVRRARQTLNSLLEEFGASKVVAAPMAGLSFLATVFGITLQTPAATTAALAVTLAVVLIVIAILTTLLRHERRRRTRSDAVIRRLTQTILDQQSATAYTWERWIEVADVGRGGDMVLRQWRTLRAGDEPVHVLWAAFEQTPHGHLTAAQKRGVAVTANSFSTAPDGTRVLGPSFDLTKVWYDEVDALVVYLCLTDPLPPGEHLDVLFTWIWPGAYRWLINGGQDTVFFTRKKGSVGSIDVTYTFSADTGVTDRMVVRPMPGTPMPLHTGTDDSIFTVCYNGPLPERVGFILEVTDHQPGLPRHRRTDRRPGTGRRSTRTP